MRTCCSSNTRVNLQEFPLHCDSSSFGHVCRIGWRDFLYHRLPALFTNAGVIVTARVRACIICAVARNFVFAAWCSRDQGFGQRSVAALGASAASAFQKLAAQSATPVVERVVVEEEMPNHQSQNGTTEQLEGIRHDYQHQQVRG